MESPPLIESQFHEAEGSLMDNSAEHKEPKQDIEMNLEIRADSRKSNDVEENTKDELTAERRRMNGAQRKRYKWLLNHGHTKEEAAILSLKPMPTRTENSLQKSKRPRLDSTTYKEDQRNKRSKTVDINTEAGTHRLSSNQVKKGLRMAVLHVNFPVEHFTSEQMDAIQDTILKLVLGEEQESVFPGFHNIHKTQGYLVLVCRDRETAEWLKSKEQLLGSWEGAAVKVVAEGEIPKMKILTADFPDSSQQTTEEILQLLQRQNRGLPAMSWKVLKKRVEGKTVKLLLAVDPTTAGKLEMERGPLKVSFKFGTVQLKLVTKSSEEQARQASTKASTSLIGKKTEATTPIHTLSTYPESSAQKTFYKQKLVKKTKGELKPMQEEERYVQHYKLDKSQLSSQIEDQQWEDLKPEDWDDMGPLVVVWPVDVHSEYEKNPRNVLEANFPTDILLEPNNSVAVFVTLPLRNLTNKTFRLCVGNGVYNATKTALDVIVEHSSVIKYTLYFLPEDGLVPSFIQNNIPCQTNPRTYITLNWMDTGPLDEDKIIELFNGFKESLNEDLFFDKNNYTHEMKVMLMDLARKHGLKARHFGDEQRLVDRYICVYKEKPKDVILEEVLKMKDFHPKYRLVTNQLPHELNFL